MLREAVSAFGRADDGSAGPHDLVGRGHPLDRLVQVLVERIARAGGEHDVEPAVHRLHGDLLGERGRRLVHREQVAAEGLDDRLVGVEHHVQGERDPGGLADRADVVVDGVAVGDAPGRPRIADAGRIVQYEDGVERREARRDQLRAAGEPGEEVRFDEPGGDPDVRLAPLAVEPDRDVAAERAPPHHRLRRPRVVVDDAHGVDDLVAEHRPQLLGRVRPVGSGRHEDDDVVEVDDAVELLEQDRDHHVPGLRPGDVARGDRDRLTAGYPLPQRRSGDRTAQRVADRLPLVRRGRAVARGDDRAVVGNVEPEAGVPVGDSRLHGPSSGHPGVGRPTEHPADPGQPPAAATGAFAQSPRRDGPCPRSSPPRSVWSPSFRVPGYGGSSQLRRGERRRERENEMRGGRGSAVPYLTRRGARPPGRAPLRD